MSLWAMSRARDIGNADIQDIDPQNVTGPEVSLGIVEKLSAVWCSCQHLHVYISIQIYTLALQGTNEFIYLAQHERRHPNERGRPADAD